MALLFKDLLTIETQQVVDSRVLASAVTILTPYYLSRIIPLLEVVLSRDDSDVPYVNTDELFSAYGSYRAESSKLAWLNMQGILGPAQRTGIKSFSTFEIKNLKPTYKLLNILLEFTKKHPYQSVFANFDRLAFIAHAKVKNGSSEYGLNGEGKLRTIKSTRNLITYLLNKSNTSGYVHLVDLEIAAIRNVEVNLIELGLLGENGELTKLGLEAATFLIDFSSYLQSFTETSDTLNLTQLESIQSILES